MSCRDPTPVGAGYEQCGGGPIHRLRVEQCESSLPRLQMTPPVEGSTCQSDADCIALPHGYCEATLVPPGTSSCHFGCVNDAECGAGEICLCKSPVGECVSSTCTSDQDCPLGRRCQSYDGSRGCGFLSFACQTPEDTCEGDADCAGGYCDATSGAFTCGGRACMIGRPFLVEGAERVAPLCSRRDWLQGCELGLTEPPSALRVRAARAWARVGQMEHASIAAFARFALQLLQLGAPPELIERATQAMADEKRHARLAFGIASQYGGAPIGPGPLSVDDSLTNASLVEVVELVVREGCIGETVAALEAREAAEHARDPRLAQLLRDIADDEARHAELAWRFVRWALEQAGDAVAAVLSRELEHAALPRGSGPAASPEEQRLAEHGIIPEALRRQVREVALRELVRPCASALRAQFAGRLPEKAVLSA